MWAHMDQNLKWLYPLFYLSKLIKDGLNLIASLSIIRQNIKFYLTKQNLTQWALVSILDAQGIFQNVRARFQYGYHRTKVKFLIKDVFSKCDQIRRELRIWLYLLKKSLIEKELNFLPVYKKGTIQQIQGNSNIKAPVDSMQISIFWSEKMSKRI